MLSPSGRRGSVARVIAVLAIGALAVAVAVLAALALNRGTPAPSASARPIPTFAVDDETPAPPPSAVVTPAAERFLSLGDGELWRATAGMCGESPAALERSTDRGATWDPIALTAERSQVLALASVATVTADIAIADDACGTAVVRTYTAGADWEVRDNPSLSYLTPDRTMVVTPDGEIAPPCANATSVRASRGVVGLVCDGTAYRLDGDAWTTLLDEALAVDALEGEIVVAHISDACTGGATITRLAADAGAQSLGCFEDVDTASPAALSVLGSEAVLWSGDEVRWIESAER